MGIMKYDYFASCKFVFVTLFHLSHFTKKNIWHLGMCCSTYGPTNPFLVSSGDFWSRMPGGLGYIIYKSRKADWSEQRLMQKHRGEHAMFILTHFETPNPNPLEVNYELYPNIGG